MSNVYTYTLFDANPNSSSHAEAWPAHTDREIEASSDEEAIEAVREALEIGAAGLSESDGYTVGQTLYALVWDADEQIIGTPTYDITAEDLGVEVEP